MTAPTLRHARWCPEPPLRPSTMLGSPGTTRWRCPACGVIGIVTGGAEQRHDDDTPGGAR